MIDFKEIPEDGTRFEQLIREILFIYGLSPEWTGRGADSGRDLIATEIAAGTFGSYQNRWLVSCKHFAHSGRAVGIGDIPSVIDDCRRVRADGFLLACSTHPSSEVVKKLRELSANPDNRLVSKTWDSVEIEKKLSSPGGFALAHAFFPDSMSSTPWQIYNANSPSLWAAHYRDYFIYLSCRDKMTYPSLEEVELIIAKLEKIRPCGEYEYIRPRAVYFDDKNEQFFVFADYLVSKTAKFDEILTPKDFDDVLQDGQGLHNDGKAMWYLTSWEIMLVKTNLLSDHFHRDHKTYYKPYLSNFEHGIFRSATISEMLSW